MKSILNKKTLFTMGSLGAILAIILHHNRRPFQKSDDFSVNIIKSGVPIQAEVMKPMYMDDVYYIRIDKANDTDYPWIVFSPGAKTIASPVGLYESFLGYSYTHSDQGLGILLTDPKLEDNWVTSFKDGVIACHNDSLNIKITPN